MSEAVLTIGGQRYALADLPLQARDRSEQIDFCQRNIARLQRELGLLLQIRESALSALPALLDEKPSTDRPPAAEVVALPKRRHYWPSAPACKPRLG